MQAGSKAVAHISYVECVRSLYVTPTPMLVMSIGYIASFAVLAFQTSNEAFAGFAIAGVFSSSLRAGAFLHGAAYADSAEFTVEKALTVERVFAAAYFQFACLLAVSSAYALTTADARIHALMICLIVGYGAGASATVGLRPKIALPSLLIAIVPSIIVIGLKPDPIYWTIALLMAGLLVGGAQNLIARYRSVSEGIARRLTFQTLARHDALTDLPNRLGLREWFEDNHAVGRKLAIHCLDLNGFKPVNDVHGHPVGDDLLRAVAMRLSRAIRPTDIAARIGGDEFVVIQSDASDLHEVATLARRLRFVVSEPFVIRGHPLSISTSVGYVLSNGGEPDLDGLLQLADAALYHAKRGGFGIACSNAADGKFIDIAA